MSAHVSSAADETSALDEFHQLLRKLAPEPERASAEKRDEKATAADLEAAEKRAERAIHFLRTGFIPDHKEVLIDAGVHCIPYLESDDTLEDAARARLEGITTKLKLIPQDAQTRLAIEEFQAKIKAHKKHRTREDIFYGGCFLLIVVLIIGGIIWLFSRC